jgi:hypothetical protein
MYRAVLTGHGPGHGSRAKWPTIATRHEREHLCGHHLVLEHLLPLSLLLLSDPLKDYLVSLLVLLKLCLCLLLHLDGGLSLSCQRLYQ